MLARPVLYRQATRGWFEKLDRSQHWDRESSALLTKGHLTAGTPKGGRNASCGSLFFCGIVVCMEEKPHYTPTQWVVHIVGLLMLPGALLWHSCSPV